MGNFQDRGFWIRIRFLKIHGSGSGLSWGDGSGSGLSWEVESESGQYQTRSETLPAPSPPPSPFVFVVVFKSCKWGDEGWWFTLFMWIMEGKRVDLVHNGWSERRDLCRFTNDARVSGHWPKLKFKTCHWSVQSGQLLLMKRGGEGVVDDNMVMVDRYSDSHR